MRLLKKIFQALFVAENGKVVIGQKPNVPILIWAFFSLLARLLGEGSSQIVSEYIAFGSIFTWAWLELFQGVNLFRKILGGFVLVFVVLSKVA